MATPENFTNKLNELYEAAGGKGSPFVRNLAQSVGVTPRSIHKLLDGSDPSLELALKISSHLRFSLDTWEDRESAPVDQELEQFKKDALSALIHASDAEWRAVRPSLSALLPAVKQKKATS